MNYIQKLKKERDELIEFVYAYKALAASLMKYENTSYKGDAMTEIKRCREHLNKMLPKIEAEIINPERKEAVNG